DVGAVDLPVADVEGERRTAEVVRRTVVERQVARAHQLARARLRVAALQGPSHPAPPLGRPRGFSVARLSTSTRRESSRTPRPRWDDRSSFGYSIVKSGGEPPIDGGMACDHRNFARSPIRVWHVDATTILRGNVVDSAQQGFLLECRAGDSAGCADGTILLQDNTVAGGVRNLAG